MTISYLAIKELISINVCSIIKRVDSSNGVVDEANMIDKTSVINKANTRTF